MPEEDFALKKVGKISFKFFYRDAWTGMVQIRRKSVAEGVRGQRGNIAGYEKVSKYSVEGVQEECCGGG